MANNLKDHLKEVADAIQAKKGTTDLINPQDFATEIEGISGGGESSWRYFKFLEDVGKEQRLTALGVVGLIAKGTYINYGGEEFRAIISAGLPLTGMEFGEIEAIGTNMMALGGNDTELDGLLSTGWMTEITKEQFYDLNA